MKLYKQKICDSVKGDCFKACVATVLQIDPDLLPDTSPADGCFIRYKNALSSFGIDLKYGDNCWIEGYWIATVSSKNFSNTAHAIVMKGQEVFFDPSPKKRYRKGRNLLGKGIVKGGYTFLIADISKFRMSAIRQVEG